MKASAGAAQGGLRCALLGSGSGGNATLVAAGETAILVDCGYSARAFEERAAALQFDPASLTAIFVTHEHDDHAGGVDTLARKYGIPVHATRGTRVATEARVGPLPHWHELPAHASLTVGGLEITPVAVPHDAREPRQFVFGAGASRLGILTDLGDLTPHVIREYGACQALVLEFNHDPALLAASAYPARLKRRIGGGYGHLSNQQALQLLRSLAQAPLELVVAAHLSERTNHPELVAGCLAGAAAEGQGFRWSIAAQDEVLPWFEVGAGLSA